MILGIGLDLAEIHRIGELWRRNRAGLLRRVFTDAEAEYCDAKSNPSQHLAGRFAAKEAFLKALGTGWAAGAALRDVEIVSQPSAPPRIALHGRTAEISASMGVQRIHLSITHAGDYAAATVVLEGR